MSLGETRFEGEARLIMRNRFAQPTLLQKRVSQIGMGIDEIWLEG